ncbi:solute:sodium symporter family transporter [Mucilaginibacter lappiensis]|uniref:SSS family solute:Na+ symporter n=1 Tax=Mucilaginibacter lappiensis TaxID=354630 RepID=A0A841JC39_9SPHI|nr:solute:sodium symporter family transporter [Mucilaginibacter lappiensis]MBB6126158.1 SSS family solute:Na+ symporter [Mucilaginibacter lappiensis]
MNWLILTSFLFFTSIVGLVSWYKSRKSKLNTLNSLFLADRSLSFLLVGGGLLFTNINTATIIGENELTYTHNMSVMAWGMTSVLAMLLVSEFLMPMYLRLGIATTPDYLIARYSPGIGKLVSFIFLISYIINLLPSVLYSGAVAFNGLFHFSEIWHTDYWTTIWILIWVMGTVGCLYSLLGGLKAISISDTLLGLGIFAGGLFLPFFGLKHLGQGSIMQGLHTLLHTHQEHLNSIGSNSDPIPFGTLFTGMLLVNLYYWGTEQYIVQQVLASKDLKSCQKGIAVACLGKLISPLLLNIPGLIAVHIFTHLDNSAEVFPKLDSLVSPPFIAGYIAAIIFGAALTTFNAGLNSSSTLFVLNIYKPWMEKRSRQTTEKSMIGIAKRFEIIICLTAMLIAPFIIFVKNGFYTYVQIVNGFFNVPIFTIMFMGFVTKRVPAIAAKLGLLFFIVAYGLTQLVFDLHIHFLHILAILFVITCGLMLVIGKLYPMPVPYRQKLNNVVDMKPWENRHIYSGILLLLMVLMFILFSPLVLAK